MRPIATNKLITVDAPDGSGKGEMVNALCFALADIYGKESVVKLSPGRFDVSVESLKFQSLLINNKLSSTSKEHNACFLGALGANYEHVIKPLVNEGKLVIADSSELRALAYILDTGSAEAIEDTYKWIDRRQATAGIIARNRILIRTSPKDCLNNIFSRGKLDYGDPQDLIAMKRRHQMYKSAEEYIRDKDITFQVNWLSIPNKRYSDAKRLHEHLRSLIMTSIIPFLKLI